MSSLVWPVEGRQFLLEWLVEQIMPVMTQKYGQLSPAVSVRRSVFPARNMRLGVAKGAAA